ncbi:MAG: hypothetical protein FWC86_04685 [Coriobacteriia bacterium]|nr:hypothetical protein [Coriobacteriia bacterium]
MTTGSQYSKEHHPVSAIRRYYIMGVVGVGKSTLREQLRTALQEGTGKNQSFNIYEEWPEAMATEVTHAMESMSRCSAEEIQEWIFSQLADKNELISSDQADLHIIDRSPLDTYAFYPPQEWEGRAQQLLNVLHEKDSTPLAPGELIFLHGSPRIIYERMDRAREYSVNSIAQQQSSFELLIDYLARDFNYTVKRIDVRNQSPEQVATKAQDIMSASNYSPLNMQNVVEVLAGK